MSYQIICLDCGTEFTHRTKQKIYCDDCLRERQKKARLKHRLKKADAKKKIGKKSLLEIMRELREYNEKHGTHLTYGQYVSMTEKRVTQ